MKEDASLQPLGSLSGGALRHQVVQRLLKAIVQGELATGSRLVTNKLAFRLGVSATPIREALVELEQSGIIELLHNRGAIVKPFGRKELRDFYGVRSLLECEAARLACGHIEHEQLNLIRSDLERLFAESGGSHEDWVKMLFDVDHRVHGVPVAHCSNKRLIAEIERYYTLGDAMGELAGFNHSRELHEASMAPLLDLVDAMQLEKAEAAAAAMRQHISLVAAMVEMAMFDGKKD